MSRTLLSLRPLALALSQPSLATEAVKAFQQAKGIKATGRVGKKTWDALEASAKGWP